MKRTLSPTAVLQRIPDLKVRLRSDNGLSILTKLGTLHCNAIGWDILKICAYPTPLRDLLDALRCPNAQAWMDRTNTLLNLYQNGILQDTTGVEAEDIFSEGSGFDNSEIHIAMLNDRRRTHHYLAGIGEVVRPGDVVLDMGTGTGILAMAAARAGAKQVYAVEVGRIGRAADELFRANGFADRITLVPGWSTEITLPERADVLVSETIGNEPLSERALELFLDAKKRLLKPDARFIPARLLIHAIAVTVPDAEYRKHRFTPETIAVWRARYGFDLSRLCSIQSADGAWAFLESPSAIRWPVLGGPVLLYEMDLRSLHQTQVEVRHTLTIATPGRLTGIVVYFDLALGPTAYFSGHPGKMRGSSWRTPVWLLPDALPVSPGDTFDLTYRYRAAGPAISCVRRSV